MKTRRHTGKEPLSVLRNVQAVRTPECRRQDRSRLVRVSFDAADALTIVNIIVVICHKIQSSLLLLLLILVMLNLEKDRESRRE